MQQAQGHEAIWNIAGTYHMEALLLDLEQLDHLWDHLAEVHCYERAANEYTTVDRHLKRKHISALKGLFVLDIRELFWTTAHITAAERTVKQRMDTTKRILTAPQNQSSMPERLSYFYMIHFFAMEQT
ncbi:hypothetical protein INS49_007726 [Diaporthe citri]|uniref:uncharacterized protein n=1 Tax=Diaporthe citri TaxID=83186 RepID=UPI001C811AE5|nr:uncharacterized protein INS49_007726 [Diaporthe citri]KAG6362634.1 hypothetical protein INS49_007726 [Diaporthe citri]